MVRVFLLVLCSTVVLGQVSRYEPFDIALQSYRNARASGNFEAAAILREEARGMLAQTGLSSPMWLYRIEVMAQVYQSAGRRAEARAIVQDALSRIDSLGESHPIRIQLLNRLADSWQQDGNLLKAVWYREKAVAAMESAPPSDSLGPPTSSASRLNPAAVSNRYAGRSVVLGATGGVFRPGFGNTMPYYQLADLYRQLGRPESVTKVMKKIRSLIQDDPRELAAFHAQQGDIDEAVALYRKQAAQAAANPQAQAWDIAGPLQTIAGLYQRQQRWEDAAATLQQAVGLVENSGKPEARNQAVGMRITLAHLFQQRGQSRAADQIYEALLTEIENGRNGQQFQVLQAYANQLSVTNRAVQGEELLKNYLANHTLSPPEQANILFSLSEMAGRAGRKELADEYRRAAMEKQRATEPQRPEEGTSIGPDLEKAQAAANQGNLNEAVDLALRAMASASLALDREQVTWRIPSIAFALANKKAAEEGERLFSQLFLLLETWSVDHASPLTQALVQYSRFLIGKKDRWGQVPAAIDRYRALVMATQGAESHELEQAIQLRIDFARARGAQAEAVQGAEELLAFEESLSGATSEPYMRAARTAVDVYEYSGNLERALSLHRQMIAIADMTLRANDVHRGFVRINAGLALAKAGQFEEAERLANEAVAVGERMRPPQTAMFAPQAEEIRRMKMEAESRPAPTDDAARGGVATDIRWFHVNAPPTPQPADKKPAE